MNRCFVVNPAATRPLHVLPNSTNSTVPLFWPMFQKSGLRSSKRVAVHGAQTP